MSCEVDKVCDMRRRDHPLSMRNVHCAEANATDTYLDTVIMLPTNKINSAQCITNLHTLSRIFVTNFHDGMLV